MPKNLGGHVTLATPLFQKFLRGHVRTVPGNMHVKYVVRSFNRFGAIIDRSSSRRCTHRHTMNTYLRRSLHSLGRDNKLKESTVQYARQICQLQVYEQQNVRLEAVAGVLCRSLRTVFINSMTASHSDG